MMTGSRVLLRCAAVLCMGLLAAHCADSQLPPDHDSGRGGSDAVDADSSDTPDDTGVGSDGDNTDVATPDADLGGGDDTDTVSGDPDTGGGDDSGGDPVVDEPAPDIPAPVCPFDPSAATFPDTYLNDVGDPRQVLLVIESIDFDDDIVVVRNVSNETGTGVTIDFDTTWRAYTNGANQFHLGGAFNLAPGARLRIHTSESGVEDTDDVYLGSHPMRLDACGGEFVLVHSTDEVVFTNHPGFIEAYIAWGNRSVYGDTATHNDEALAAEAWDVRFSDSGYAAPTCWEAGESWCATGGADGPCETTDVGLLATGDVTDPFGWTRVETPSDGEICFY